MIEHLPEQEQAWLERFFASPNELNWSSLLDGSAPSLEMQRVRQWLVLLGSHPNTPLILPFMRGGKVTGWYATTQGEAGGYELQDEINAWLGQTWLDFLEPVPKNSGDPMATALRGRFGGTVYRFSSADDSALQAISARLSEYAGVLERRPLVTRARVRPVGAIRSDFERALLAGDGAQAQVMITEFKQTGRLNEENLRYLEVRRCAGLGLWQQIARDPWLIKTLADLVLPPQVLADLIEALYRTYVEEAETAGDGAAMRDAFEKDIATPYAKLFASRRGIRSPRVVKSFVLYEQLQPCPNHSIIEALLGLLPKGTDTSLFEIEPIAGAAPSPGLPSTSDRADEAFDDGQFDRAFEFYLQLPVSRKTISRLVSCVGAIGTKESCDRLLGLVEAADSNLIENLPPPIATILQTLRSAQPVGLSPASISDTPQNYLNPWMAWAERLQTGQNLSAAERDVQSAVTNWDASEIRENGQLAQKFADIIGGLNGDAGKLARASIPQLYKSFFPDDLRPTLTARPIASLLFVLIAMDESLSRSDLDLLAQLVVLLIEQGISPDEYVSLMGDLQDVQKRIGSYAYLPWSLDICETLAILPCPTENARDARLRLFLQVLGEASGFAHRLEPTDLLPIETLAKDYCVGPEAVAHLKREAAGGGADAVPLPNLNGKTIGIYTLAETAGNRAKFALEKMFPGCKVTINSDLVATTQLTGLAKIADIFVFAWKCSSHQAFYCVKDAMVGKEPIWAPGKGTASILRAVLEKVA